ncbi:G-protein coupled receptor GRL101-like protein, partial [Trichoplax sp. H2]
YLYQNLIESLQSNSFHGLTKLQKLYLDDNFLTRICNSSFDTLTALDTLMIRNNNMTHLSEYQFSGMPNVLRISLSSNQLCCIHPNTFANLTRLTSLDLSDNVISDIQGFQIPDLKALTLLMLNENQISKVLNGSFSGLKSLKKLVLRTNRISYIAHAAFEGLIQIQDIRLDGNWIVSVAIDIFSTGAPLINYVGLSKNKIKSVQLINTSFSLIQHLDLSHNVIRKSIILSGNNLQKLNLSANRIDHVSELKNLNLSLFDSIDFSNNRILDINNQIIPNTQEFPKIRALYIKSNKLNQIHQRAFQNLQNLEILDLQNNNIRVLSFAENLRSLEKLIMGKNKIQQLKSQYFQNLTNLTELDVSCNQIRRLENHMFKSLTKLKSLKLSGNRIELIKTQAFNGLIALTNLQLEYNLIQSIDGIFKNHLQNLQTLNISNNKITSIGGSSFLSMSYLEQLWLDNNQIPSLPTNSFNGLSSLIIISLSENLIGNLSCESFTNLNQLDELRLASNNISFIHHNCASVFSRLNKIDFNFNNLVRNGINISNSILDSLSGFPFELKLAGNNIKHLQTSYFRQNILLRSIDIGYNELNDEEMAGLISSIIILNEECQSFKKIFRCYEYSINVAGNNMHSIPPGFFNYLKEFILKINITNNKLQTVDASEIFSSHDYILQELYISNNRIQYFTNFKKLQFYKLRILNIDNNNIADICQKNLGRTWPNLEYLSANKNNIKVLQSRCFQYSSKLKFISLKENPINSLNPRSFYGPPILDTVLSTRDYLCCYVPAQVTFCTPIYDQDALSTCDDMLSHPTLQYFVWIIGITAFVGNILVFLHYCQQSKQKHPPISVTTVLLTNLALADFFMSIYLIIIGIADQIYRGYYSMYVEPWLTSVPCYSASFLVSLSSLMSVYMMIIISIDRFICITFPFSTKRLKVSSARNVLLVGWLFCIVFAGIPVVFSIGKPGESRLYKYSSICMPSNVNNVYYRTWILCYTFLTMVAWILTCALYFGMFFSMRQSSKSVRKIGSVNRDRKIAIRLFLIIITDLASWMPYYILVIQVLFTGTIDIIVLQFVIIFALPINSAINPYLYTITNLSTFNKAFSQVVPSGVQQAITNIRSTELTRQGSEISRRQREFNLSHATRSDSVTPRKSISVILLDEKQSSNLIVDQTPVGQGIFKEVEFGYSDTVTNISGQTVKHGLHHITPRRNDPSSITNIH